MGAVYLATHTVLEKQVALKVLHGEFARKPDLVERFMQEAKAASRIRHENVIDISDFGATPEGLVFFAMELLQGPRPPRGGRAREARRPAAAVVAHARRSSCRSAARCRPRTRSGIVHRDLKPENIYLVEFLGDPDFVKLLDFGIAKLTDVSNEEGGRKLTKTGMLFGTPEYMSPEQARGEQRRSPRRHLRDGLHPVPARHAGACRSRPRTSWACSRSTSPKSRRRSRRRCSIRSARRASSPT